MPEHTRDDQGRQVVTLTHMQDGEEFPIPLTVTDGATYWFRGHAYRAALEEDASDTLACFVRLPIQQTDDEPGLFLDRNDGSVSDDTGQSLGTYDELEEAEVEPVNTEDVRDLLTSTSMDPIMVRWADTLEVEVVSGALFYDVSYVHYNREHAILATAADLRSQGDWDIDNPTDADLAAFAEQLHEG